MQTMTASNISRSAPGVPTAEDLARRVLLLTTEEKEELIRFIDNLSFTNPDRTPV